VAFLFITKERSRMKKYLYICSLFTLATFQCAYAQKYEYMGHTSPTYININGEQYVRIPKPKKRNLTSTSLSHTPSQVSTSKHYTLSSITKLKPYIGLEAGYNSLDRITIKDEIIAGGITTLSYSQLPDKNITLSGVLGLKITPHISLEAFYQDTIAKKNKKGKTTITNNTVDVSYTTNSTTSLSFNSFGLDFIYNTPLYNPKLQLLLALGIGSYNIDAKYKLKKIYSIGEDITVSTSNQSIGYRFGIGGEYIFNQHFGLKTMLRYIKLTDDKIINNMIELSTGIKYYF